MWNTVNHFSHMATHARIIQLDNVECQEMCLEIETERDDSRKRKGEKRRTVSVFITIMRNIETEEMTLTHIKVLVFDPKLYRSPHWPKTVDEFDGETMIEDVRELIARENACIHLYKKIPELSQANCYETAGAGCVFGDITKETSQEAYSWFKSLL